MITDNPPFSKSHSLDVFNWFYRQACSFLVSIAEAERIVSILKARKKDSALIEGVRYALIRPATTVECLIII
jgi:hypothetical protein